MSEQLNIEPGDILEVTKHKLMMNDLEQNYWKKFLNVCNENEEALVGNADLAIKSIENANLPYIEKWFITAAWAKKAHALRPQTS